MGDFLVISGWSGRRKVPVQILGETPEGFRIRPLERVLLPGRGFLEKGKATLVPKASITLAKASDATEASPASKRSPLFAYAMRFFIGMLAVFRSSVSRRSGE